MTTRIKPIAAALAAAASLTMLAGCSADTTTAVEATTDPTAQASTQPSDMPQGAPGAGGTRMLGTFGLIAEVQGTTLQVQGDDGQTAVTFTDATSFTTQVTGTLDDIQVGLCVSGAGSADDDGTATQLTVTEPVDGECQGFGSGMGGGMGRPDGMDGERTPPSGAPSDAGGAAPSGAPSAMPSDMPSGGPGDSGQFGSFISGVVTAVDGSTVTVESTGDEATVTTITVADDAAITATTAGTSDDAVAGLCALAQGDTDATGAVTATSIQLSEATDGECTFGGGMR